MKSGESPAAAAAALPLPRAAALPLAYEFTDAAELLSLRAAIMSSPEGRGGGGLFAGSAGAFGVAAPAGGEAAAAAVAAPPATPPPNAWTRPAGLRASPAGGDAAAVSASLVGPLPPARRAGAALAAAAGDAPTLARLLDGSAAGGPGAALLGGRCQVDAALFLGRSFRAGFGPGGRLARPLNAPLAAPAGESSAAAAAAAAAAGDAAAPGRIALAPVSPLGPLAGRRDAPVLASALRAKTLAALRVHLAHSGPVEGTGGGEAGCALPQWALRADAASLAALAREYAAAALSSAAAAAGRAAPAGPPPLGAAASAPSFFGAAAAAPHPAGAGGNGAADGLAAAVAAHEAGTWALLGVLLGRIAGDSDDEEEESESEMEAEEGEESGGDEEMAGGGGRRRVRSPAAARLAAMQRRADLGAWAAAQAGPATEAAVAAAGSLEAAALALVGGGQAGAAAALAAAGGDTHLSALLAAAGRSGAAAADVGAARRGWAAARLEEGDSAERRALYALLSGDTAPAAHALAADWRRRLGLHLRHAAGAGETADAALRSFLAADAAGGDAAGAAAPPMWAAAAGASAAPTAGTAPAPDIQLALLSLASRRWALAPGELGALLRPAGYSPNPLDAGLAWHLLSAAAAVEALPTVGLDGGPHPAALAAAADLLGLLALLPGAGHWGAYVALHLPDDPSRPGLRDAAVAALLAASAPEWGADAEARAFLTEALGLPAAWLHAAQAARAGAERRPGRAAALLAAAGRAAEAHALAAGAVAPALLLEPTRHGELRALLAALAPAAAPGGPLASEWPLGCGPYAAYLELLDSRGRGDAPAAAAAASRLAALLPGAAAAAARGAWAAAPGGGALAGGSDAAAAAALQRAALQRMADAVGRELLARGAAGEALRLQAAAGGGRLMAGVVALSAADL